MSTNSELRERYSLATFLILTPLLSLAIPLFLPLPPEIIPLTMVLVPALLAILLTALTQGGSGVAALLARLVQWRVGIKWFAIAFALALGLRLAISVLALLLGWIPAIQLTPWSLPEYIIIGVFIVIGAVTEELGWRGYVLPRLLAGRSALSTALFIGVIWGIVHLGLILPGQMNAGSHWLPNILYIVGLSVVLTWLYVQTGGSLVIPILFHFGQSYFVFLNGGITLSQQLWLMTGVMLGIGLVLILFYGRNLQRSPVQKPTLVSASQAESKS
ncbi:MAG TPA: CPBP family intramembrane glutamic endopeptidase [Anaerolineales bacterium]|nr:CPBP family intramembrane glutamic endopeptidase [Anaerolineales bacterium]